VNKADDGVFGECWGYEFTKLTKFRIHYMVAGGQWDWQFAHVTLTQNLTLSCWKEEATYIGDQPIQSSSFGWIRVEECFKELPKLPTQTYNNEDYLVEKCAKK